MAFFHEPQIPLSAVDEDIAREKGRLLAAQELARDSHKRKEMEQLFGTAYMHYRFPEVYAPSPFEARLIDKIHFKAP
jgi:hypothetical protein